MFPVDKWRYTAVANFFDNGGVRHWKLSGVNCFQLFYGMTVEPVSGDCAVSLQNSFRMAYRWGVRSYTYCPW